MKFSDQATRCPSCQTVFRVVADQLRVSEGWVRCGRCSNVFNAAEHMVDTEGGWARLTEDAPDNPRAEAPPDGRRTARGPAHRARQDGPDHDRLSNKIEAALARSLDVPAAAQPGLQRPAPAELARQWPDSQFHAGPAVAPPQAAPFQAPKPQPPAPAPRAQAPGGGSAAPAASGLTFRRPAAANTPLRPSPGPEPDEPWDAEPPLRHEPADDWQTQRPARPSFDEPDTPAVGRFQPPAPARVEPKVLDTAPLPLQTTQPAYDTQPSYFDETRPEMEWAPAQDTNNLDGLRAEPRSGPRLSPTAKPGFMRKAEREQHWRQPHRRALLLGALAGSALLLVAQATLAYRDLVAARFPAARPVLEGLCAGLGCTVQAARNIESLAVESSGLVRVDKTAQYQLQVTLRNRANLELALPALDVTFTDNRGEVISRKVLLPQDLGSTIDKKPGSHGGTVAAGREVTLQGTLQTTGGAPEVVAGYTVELFYP